MLIQPASLVLLAPPLADHQQQPETTGYLLYYQLSAQCQTVGIIRKGCLRRFLSRPGEQARTKDQKIQRL